jgi:hypothetical protein
MPKADFTYEVRKLPTPGVGIEDYVVRMSDEAVGTVAAALERAGGERLLLIPPAQEGRVRGPVDRPEWAKVITLFFLAGVTVARGYRLYRNPYEPRSAQ